MKKTFIIAGFILLSIAQLSAQVSFRPGLRAGVNFSSFTNSNTGILNQSTNNNNTPNNFEYLTGLYLGVYGALKLTKFYTLQPEIDYSQQGAKRLAFAGVGQKTFSVSYLSLVMINKITFTDKFNLHAGPTLDIVTGSNYRVRSDIDLAFVLGAGYNFSKNLAVEARIKSGIIPAYQYFNSDNYNDGYYNYSYNSSSYNNVAFSLGVAYTFDFKK